MHEFKAIPRWGSLFVLIFESLASGLQVRLFESIEYFLSRDLQVLGNHVLIYHLMSVHPNFNKAFFALFYSWNEIRDLESLGPSSRWTKAWCLRRSISHFVNYQQGKDHHLITLMSCLLIHTHQPIFQSLYARLPWAMFALRQSLYLQWSL